MRALNVTIVGAGIGGLSCALALRAAGHEVHVYERAPELRPIGAGICMWPNGARALEALGVAPLLAEASPLLRELRYRTPTGELMRSFSLSDFTKRVGQRSYPLARADLHEALLARLGNEPVHLNAECVGVRQDAQEVVTSFSDGSEVRSDLLIGADGIRSGIREQVLPGVCELRHYYCSWVGLVPGTLDLTPVDTFTFHIGDHQRIGLLNVGRGRTYFFADAPLGRDEEPPGEDARAQLKGLFSGWSDPVQTLIDHVDPAACSRLPICDFDPLPSFVAGRVVLLGDAAHATTPTLGQGGALAMEDSLVLARHLAESDDLDHALAAYDQERLPRSTRVVLAARSRTQAMLGVVPKAEQEWYERIADDRTQDFIDQLSEIAASAPALVVG